MERGEREKPTCHDNKHTTLGNLDILGLGEQGWLRQLRSKRWDGGGRVGCGGTAGLTAANNTTANAAVTASATRDIGFEYRIHSFGDSGSGNAGGRKRGRMFAGARGGVKVSMDRGLSD